MKKTNKATAKSKPSKPAGRAKPYWEMSTAQLQQATAEFEREFVGETFGQPTPQQRAQDLRARRKRGRPRIGQGTKTISLTIEKGLLAAVDKLARRQKAKRAELICRGLRAILNGEITLGQR